MVVASFIIGGGKFAMTVSDISQRIHLQQKRSDNRQHANESHRRKYAMLIVRKFVGLDGKKRDDDADNCGGHFQFLQYADAARRAHIGTQHHKGQSFGDKRPNFWTACKLAG